MVWNLYIFIYEVTTSKLFFFPEFFLLCFTTFCQPPLQCKTKYYLCVVFAQSGLCCVFYKHWRLPFWWLRIIEMWIIVSYKELMYLIRTRISLVCLEGASSLPLQTLKHLTHPQHLMQSSFFCLFFILTLTSSWPLLHFDLLLTFSSSWPLNSSSWPLLHLDLIQPLHDRRFDTGVGGFTFANQYLQVATSLPSRNLYGLGESHHQSFRHDLNYRTWPMFARDQPPGPVSSRQQVWGRFVLCDGRLTENCYQMK